MGDSHMMTQPQDREDHVNIPYRMCIKYDKAEDDFRQRRTLRDIYRELDLDDERARFGGIVRPR